MSEKNQKAIDVEQVVNYLNRSFATAVQKAGPVLGSKNTKGTDLYTYQVDFTYLVDEIQRGPVYIVPKLIADANELIDRITSLKKSEEVVAG
jgi:hypothetical protein